MRFCSHCGNPVVRRVPTGDNMPRHVCPSCGTVHYQNPRMVVGCIPAWEDKVLLCRRAIAPREGWWTLPAGYLENGETTLQGAVRETLEEANARVDIEQLFTVVNLPHIDQVYLLFRASLRDLDFSPGPESREVALFAEHQVPWDELAFPTVDYTLKHYFDDLKSGHFRARVKDMIYPRRKRD